MMLPLKRAIETGQLEAFIEQCEANGIGPAPFEDVGEALRRAIKAPKGSRPASRSPDAGGSREK